MVMNAKSQAIQNFAIFLSLFGDLPNAGSRSCPDIFFNRTKVEMRIEIYDANFFAFPSKAFDARIMPVGYVVPTAKNDRQTFRW